MLLRQNRRTTKRAAFTLMEIIVVVAIILILAGAGVFVFTGVLGETQEKRAKMDVMSIEKAVLTFKTNYGYYPQDLQTLVNVQPNGSPALLKESVLVDPWQQPYIYEPTNLHPKTAMPHVYSNGTPGKNMVISNWD